MNLKKITLCLIILSCVYQVNAQEILSTKVQKIKQLMEISKVGEMGIYMFDRVIEMQKRNADEKQLKMLKKFENEIKIDDFIALIVPIYDKYYSEEDVNNLIAFYLSPTGKNVIEYMPSMQKECSIAGQFWAQKIVEKISQELKETEGR